MVGTDKRNDSASNLSRQEHEDAAFAKRVLLVGFDGANYYVADIDSTGAIAIQGGGPGGGGNGAILDYTTSTIGATVFDYANSAPLAVRLTDTNGDYVAGGGGGGTETVQQGTIPWLIEGTVTSSGPITVDGTVTVANTITTDGTVSVANIVTVDVTNIAAGDNRIGRVLCEYHPGTLDTFGALVTGASRGIGRAIAIALGNVAMGAMTMKYNLRGTQKGTMHMSLKTGLTASRTASTSSTVRTNDTPM